MGGAPSAFALLDQHRYVRAQTAQIATSKGEPAGVDMSVDGDATNCLGWGY
jgi:hypothetical protein